MATLGSNATLYGAVADALAALGFTVQKWPGWATRTASKTPARIVTPTSVCIHHTGGNYTKTTYIRDGDPGRSLSGPLTNWHITRDGVVHLLGVGYQNHAGLSYQPNYDRIVAGTAPLTSDMKPGADSRSFSANRYMMAVEVNGDGGPDDFTPLQYRAAVALAAEYHRIMGWKVPRVGAHKELTRRKPGDPVCNMGVFRSDVLAAIATPWGPTPGAAPTLGDRVLSKDGTDRGPDVAELSALLSKLGYNTGTPADEFGPLMDAAVRDFQTKNGLKVDGEVGPLTTKALEAAAATPEPTPEPTPDPEPTPAGLDFRFGLAAMQASQWGGPKAGTSKRGDYLRGKLACSVYAVTEMPEVDRDATRQALGGMNRWLTFPVGYVAVLFDSTKWKHTGSESVTFGTPYHGAVRAQLVGGNGQALDVIALHVRPRAAFPTSANAGKVADAKAGDVHRAVRLARDGVPTILAGDFNGGATDALTQAGFTRATGKVDTLDGPGTQVLDQVWVRGLPVRYSTLVESPVSDHDSWRVGSTLPSTGI